MPFQLLEKQIICFLGGFSRSICWGRIRQTSGDVWSLSSREKYLVLLVFNNVNVKLFSKEKGLVMGNRQNTGVEYIGKEAYIL